MDVIVSYMVLRIKYFSMHFNYFLILLDTITKFQFQIQVNCYLELDHILARKLSKNLLLDTCSIQERYLVPPIKYIYFYNCLSSISLSSVSISLLCCKNPVVRGRVRKISGQLSCLHSLLCTGEVSTI